MKLRRLSILSPNLRKYMKENQDLKEQLQDMSGMLEGIDVSNLPKFTPTATGREDRDLIIWLSDMHIWSIRVWIFYLCQ